MPLTAFPKWHPTNTALYGHRTVCFDSFTKPRTVWTYRLMTHETAQYRDVPDMPFYVYNLHYSINKVGESSLISRNLSLWLRLKNIPVPHRLLSGQGLHRPQYSLWCRYHLRSIFFSREVWFSSRQRRCEDYLSFSSFWGFVLIFLITVFVSTGICSAFPISAAMISAWLYPLFSILFG